MIYASFGSISHGTMREEDLIPDFAHELEYHVQRNAEHFCSDEGRKQRDSFLNLVWEARELETDEDSDDYVDQESASDVLHSLFDALQYFAPPYAYFGAHEGDGSDYGFWLDSSFTDEFDGLKVSDLSEIPDDYEGEALVVNDHGNMSLYVASNGNYKEIWGVV